MRSNVKPYACNHVDKKQTVRFQLKNKLNWLSFRLLDLTDKSSSTGYKGKCEGGVKHFQYKQKTNRKECKRMENIKPYKTESSKWRECYVV